MHFLLIPLVALKALRQNMMRTALTMLGIVIGVGAVICVVAVGDGAQANVERAITNIGANMVWIEAGGVNRNGVRTGSGGTRSLTLGDYDAVREHIALVTNVTPQADTRVSSSTATRTGHDRARRQAGVSRAQRLGRCAWRHVRTSTCSARTRVRPRADGLRSIVRYAGSIGGTIRVNNLSCSVIGVLDVKGQSATGQDQDDQFLMPY